MNRYLDDRIRRDLRKKMVFLVGPRQVGKTTFSQLLLAEMGGQYLNYDVAEDRRLIEAQLWDQRSPLLVLDEIHKMPQWKSWLKGVVDGKPTGQQLLVTGSVRLDTFRQTGDSLAGRFFALRLHPISVREWTTHSGATPEQALTHLLERGGFPEPCLTDANEDAERWRRPYFDGLVRHDVLEFSRLQEVGSMRLFAEMLRSRVGSPLSLASIARDLHLSPVTLAKYLDILQALFIVFVVRPWHRNIARATLQAPKVYFFDTGLVLGDAGLRFENMVACALLKQVEWQQDAQGKSVGLHYIRTKDGAEVDFCLSEGDTLTDLVECKLTDAKPHRALVRFAEEWPQARATQLLRDLRNGHDIGRIEVRAAAGWLNALDV
nr:ATP-binding protein [uncultured Albidiferax sp.]